MLNLNGATPGPSWASTSKYITQLLANAALVDFFHAKVGQYTISTGSKISSLASRTTSGNTFAQASSAIQPSITANAIGQSPNQYPEVTFGGTSELQYSVVPDLTQAYTRVMLFRYVSGVSQTLLDNQGSNGANSTLAINSSGFISFSHGNATINNTTPLTAGWHMVVFGHDTVTAYLSLDGAAYQTAATNNTLTTIHIIWGAANNTPIRPFTGGSNVLAMLSGGPLSTNVASFIATFKTWARAAYGSSVSIAG